MKRLNFAIFQFLLMSVYAHGNGHYIAQAVTSVSPLREAPHLITKNQLQHIFRYANDYRHFDYALELTNSYDQFIDQNSVVNYEDKHRDYRISDFPSVISRSSLSDTRSYSLITNLDRLNTTFQISDIKFKVGRQIIGYGSSKISRPLDKFAPHRIDNINDEDKDGVDAIKMESPIFDEGYWDLAVIGGKRMKNDSSAIVLSAKMLHSQFYYQPIVIQYKKATLVGLDFYGRFFNSWWGIEVARINPPNENDYNQATFSFERKLRKDVNLYAEYHYNEIGDRSTNEYKNQGRKFGYKKGSTYYLAKNYVNFKVDYRFSDYHQFMLISYYNLDDFSYLLKPTYRLILSEDYLWEFSSINGLGQRSRDFGEYNSEFASYGQTFFTKLIHFF